MTLVVQVILVERLHHVYRNPGDIAIVPRDVDVYNSVIDCWIHDQKVLVQFPTGITGEFSFPQLSFCADSFGISLSLPPPPGVTAVGHKRSWLFCQNYRWQITAKHTYTLHPRKSQWVDYAVKALCWNIAGKQAHTQLFRKCSSADAPACLHWTDPWLKRVEWVHFS